MADSGNGLPRGPRATWARAVELRQGTTDADDEHFDEKVRHREQLGRSERRGLDRTLRRQLEDFATYAERTAVEVAARHPEDAEAQQHVETVRDALSRWRAGELSDPDLYWFQRAIEEVGGPRTGPRRPQDRKRARGSSGNH